MNSTVKTALLWVVIIVLVFLLWSLFNTAKSASEQIPFSTFLARVNEGSVEKVTIRGDEIRGQMKTAQGAMKGYVRKAAPHILVKQEFMAAPVVIELKSLAPPAAAKPADRAAA